MQDGVSVDRIVAEILTLSRESTSPTDLLLKSGEKIREYIKVDNVYYKEISIASNLGGVEEFAMNTGKPYVDNRLSGYSAFPELINYYNTGFKSCMILPIKSESRGLGIITMLSRTEDVFDTRSVELLGILAGIMSTTATMKIEKEKSINVARYFDAAFNSVIPQALVDRDGTIMKVNKSLMNFAEKPSKEFAGKNVGELFNLRQDTIDALFTGKPVLTGSIAHPERIFRITSSKVNERLTHLLFDEVTEMMQLEEKSSLLDYGDEVFMLLDNETRILWASGNTDKLLKVNMDSVLEKKLVDFVPDPDEARAEISKIADSAYVRQLRLNMGNDIFAEVKMLLVKSDRGYYCVLSNDYEKKVNSAMKVTEDLTQLSGDVVIRLDSAGLIVSINKAAEHILKYKNDEIGGTPISLLCADKDSQSRIDSAMIMSRKAGVVTDVFMNLMSKGTGEAIPFEQGIMSVNGPNGEHIGYIISGKEQLTRRMLAELKDERDEAVGNAKRYMSESELKTQFIYNISHDLRTPMTNIKGFSQLMLDGEFGALNEDQKNYMTIIITELKRLMELIERILDVAKLESGKMKLDMQPVDLKELTENPSIRSFAEVAAGKGLTFSINVDYNVPVVQADPNRLIQVFVNLIGNAMKFTEHGDISVKIYRKGKEQKVRIEVTDTGIGIRDEDKPKMFRKFYQISRKGLTRPEGTGTGLGLSIVRDIVRLHGGKTGFSSEYGKGSTFWFTIQINGKKKRKQQDDEGKDKTQPAALQQPQGM